MRVLSPPPPKISLEFSKNIGGGFKEKHVDTIALQVWMEELFDRDEKGFFLTGLPGHECGSWRIKEKTVRLATNLAKNTMPGPDGIPAAAYKRLDIAVGIFHCVAMSMSCPNGATELVEAYSDRCADDCHDFNASLLCCLPA